MTKARILADFVSDSDEFADGQIHVSEVVGAAAADSVTAKSSATGSSMIATGTTQQRDGSPSAGMLRFNSSDTSFEGYNGNAWGTILSDSLDSDVTGVTHVSGTNNTSIATTEFATTVATDEALALAIALG